MPVVLDHEAPWLHDVIPPEVIRQLERSMSNFNIKLS
jgi:hypothetical protein